MSRFVCPSTSKSPFISTVTAVVIPVDFKLRVTMSAPKVDVVPALVTLIPLTNKLEPSNVKLALSCSSPPVPA